MKYSAGSSLMFSAVILGEEGRIASTDLRTAIFAVTWEKQTITSTNTTTDCSKKLMYFTVP